MATADAVGQLDPESHAARNHDDLLRLRVDHAQLGDETMSARLRHDQHLAVRVVERASNHRAIGDVEVGRGARLRIPVGVGVITHLDLISRYGARLLIVIVVSTWMGMAVTGPLLNAMLRRPPAEGRRDE